MALLTVLAIVGKPLIPPKTFVLHPSEYTDKTSYGPLNAQNRSATDWLDESTYYLRCEAPARHNTVPCGMAFHWNPVRETGCAYRTEFIRCSSPLADPDGDGWGTENEKTCVVVMDGTNRAAIGNPLCSSAISDHDGDGWGWENDESCIVVNDEDKNAVPPACTTADSDPDGDGWGWESEQSCRMMEADKATSCAQSELVASVDATGYDGLIVKVHYEGRAPYLNLIVTDSDPKLLALGKKPKPIDTYLSTQDLRAGAVFVRLDELSVPEWWILEQNPPRKLANPSFSHITQVAFDTFDHGVHRFRVDEVKLVGERIDTETYLLAIAVLWVGYFLFEGGLRYYRLQTAYQHEQELLEGLVGGARQLEEEKVLLKHRTLTDPLTRALNRNGFAQRLQQQYGSQQPPTGTGLLVFDIDHFKALNDTYGHDAGDDVLRDLAALIASAIRAEDIFARWGGEEFLLVVDHLPQDKLTVVAEKLRQLVASHPFLKDKQLKVTVSIGAARSEPGEDFDAVFKRADKALYQAKTTRNTVAHAP